MQASELRELAAATNQLANELEQAGFSNAASDLRSAANELEQAADTDDYDWREYQREQAAREHTCPACRADLSREGHWTSCENWEG